MLKQTRVAASLSLLAFTLLFEGARDANAGSKLPDLHSAGVADKLGWIAVTRSQTTSRYGRRAKTSDATSNFPRPWLIKHGSQWLLWDTGVPEATLNDPKGWSTLPKLIVYHIDKSLTDQLAAIALKPGDIGRVAISHTHGDHIGNVIH